MRSTMKLLARTFAVFVVVMATAHGTERWLRSADDSLVGNFAIREGAPFVHEVTYYHCHGASRTYTEPVFLAANLGLFAAIALVSATLWSRSSPSGPLRLPLGADPLPLDATARDEPLCSRFQMLGRRPHWAALAAWSIGSAMAATSLLVVLGIVLQHLRWIGP
jgi:hypothetical protein